MNVIERFKKGRKVKTVLPDNKTAGERTVGSFIKLNGENFWRRVNSDGTLTKVEDGKNGTYDYKNYEVPAVVRNNTIKNLGGIHGEDPNTSTNLIVNGVSLISKITPVGRIMNKIFEHPSVLQKLIKNLEGSGDVMDNVISLALSPFRRNYYDGKLHTFYQPRDWKDPLNKYSTNTWDNNRNIVNLYTKLDDTGFKPSKIGIGSYRGTEFEKFPIYEGNYYNIDTLYLPLESKKFFVSNIGKRYVQDHDVLTKGMTNVEGTDDVQHYYMTPKLIDNKYYVDFEDVWNTDRAGLDSRNYPFILNLRIPVIFTDDNDKLNITPELSNWFALPKSWE